MGNWEKVCGDTGKEGGVCGEAGKWGGGVCGDTGKWARDSDLIFRLVGGNQCCFNRPDSFGGSRPQADPAKFGRES